MTMSNVYSYYYILARKKNVMNLYNQKYKSMMSYSRLLKGKKAKVDGNLPGPHLHKIKGPYMGHRVFHVDIPIITIVFEFFFSPD